MNKLRNQALSHSTSTLSAIQQLKKQAKKNNRGPINLMEEYDKRVQHNRLVKSIDEYKLIFEKGLKDNSVCLNQSNSIGKI